jgi:hypothetical protein
MTYIPRRKDFECDIEKKKEKKTNKKTNMYKCVCTGCTRSVYSVGVLGVLDALRVFVGVRGYVDACA